MMASIPNMRSTPLPVPAAKGAPSGDPASAGFTIQLPEAPAPEQACKVALPVEMVAPEIDTVSEAGVPALPQADAAADDGTDDGETGQTEKAEPDTGDGTPPPALVIAFRPEVPAVPGLQPPNVAPVAVDAAVPAAPAPPAEAAITPAPIAKADKPAAPAGDEADDAATPVEAPEIEAAVKALVQRKQALAKQVAALPKTARGEPSKSQADPVSAVRPDRGHAPNPAPATATIQAAALLSAADAPPQPSLSPTAAQPAPVGADKSIAVDAPRAADPATAERKLDLARDTAWLDRLAHDIARAASDDQPLRFRLHPQTLGHLQVELQQSDRGTAVRMTVDSEAARQILSDAQPRLAAEARAQGVRIAETLVDLSGSGRQAPGDQRRQDDARQTPFIRTATGADAAAVSARTPRRARLDRYA